MVRETTKPSIYLSALEKNSKKNHRSYFIYKDQHSKWKWVPVTQRLKSLMLQYWTTNFSMTKGPFQQEIVQEAVCIPTASCSLKKKKKECGFWTTLPSTLSAIQMMSNFWHSRNQVRLLIKSDNSGLFFHQPIKHRQSAILGPKNYLQYM